MNLAGSRSVSWVHGDRRSSSLALLSAVRPDRLGPGPECSGVLAVIERTEGFYNRRRRHSGLGLLTPAQAYEQMARAA